MSLNSKLERVNDQKDNQRHELMNLQSELDSQVETIEELNMKNNYLETTLRRYESRG